MNLFEGLEMFGFKGEKMTDIFAEETKSAVQEKKEVKEEEFTEDSFLLEKMIACPVCDKKFKVKIVKSGRIKRLESDFDLRPRYLYIDTLKYDVASCPHCGYTAMNRYFEHLSSTQMRLIKEQICSTFKPTQQGVDKYDYDSAITRYKLALFNTMAKRGKTSEKAYTCLKIAWLYRGKLETLDEKDAALQQEREECQKQHDLFYSQAYEGLFKAVSSEMFPICGMDQITVDYLLGAMAKYLKKYNMASKCISRILNNKSASKNIKNRAYELKEQLIEEMRESK